MSNFDLLYYLSQQKKLIDNSLRKYISFNSAYTKQISAAVKYALFPGGKRLRPILTLATADLCGLKAKEALPCACAIEFIHTYSLIHDDLPCMDNATYRRGRLSLHKKFGETLAILTGDLLLTKAFEIMVKNGITKKILPQNLLKAIRLIAHAAGVEGMLGGQVVDTCYPVKLITTNTIDYIHKYKTAALIKASVLTGAVLAGAHQKKISALAVYGEKIGLAFQIVDDIFDRDSTKTSYIRFYSIAECYEKAKQLVQKAKSKLYIFGRKAYILEQLANYVITRTE